MKLEKEVEDIRGWGEGGCKLRVPCRGFQAGVREPRYLTTWLLAGQAFTLHCWRKGSGRR